MPSFSSSSSSSSSSLLSSSPSSLLPQTVRFTFAANIFLACCSFAIVMPSIWPYISKMGGTTAFLACVVGGYSAGEAAGALVFGWLYGRTQPRPLLIGSVALSSAGALLYGAAGVLALGDVVRLSLVLIARLIQGIGSGAEQAVEQAVVGEYVVPAQRTQATSELSTWAMLGFLIGPVCGVPLSLFGGVNLGPIVIEPHAGPGVFIGLCNLVMLALTWTFFRPGPRMIRSVESLGELHPLNVPTEHPSPEGAVKANLPDTGLGSSEHIAILLCMMICLVHFCGFAAIETISTPLVAEQFHWGLTASFMLFTVAAILSLVAMVVLGRIQDGVRDSELVMITLLVGLFGFGIASFDLQGPLGAIRYVIGFVAVSVVFPLGRALTLSMLSKVVERSPNQGLYLGLAFAIGAIARIIGPFIAVSVLPTTLFRICAMLFGVTAALQMRFRSQLSQAEDAADGSASNHLSSLHQQDQYQQASRRFSFYSKRLPPSPKKLSQAASSESHSYMALP